MNFALNEKEACLQLIDWAIAEDLGRGDATSSLLSPTLGGEALYVARAEGVVAGLPVAAMIFNRHAPPPDVVFEPLLEDGAQVQRGTQLARVRGTMPSILKLERVTLNFMQRLSGIASLTRHYVDRVADLPCCILDTRKTTPGWRLLEKYAVRCGGGTNHRMGLYDGVMLKDNHLAALAAARGLASWLASAISAAREIYGASLPIEVEVDTLEQLDQVLPAGPDMVLLDNMSLGNLREAVQRRNASAPKVLLEASGGVTLATLRGIAETGVDRISVGALTHSAPALDIGLDYQIS